MVQSHWIVPDLYGSEGSGTRPLIFIDAGKPGPGSMGSVNSLASPHCVPAVQCFASWPKKIDFHGLKKPNPFYVV